MAWVPRFSAATRRTFQPTFTMYLTFAILFAPFWPDVKINGRLTKGLSRCSPRGHDRAFKVGARECA